MEAKTCAACGEQFGCGRNDADCWCATLPPLAAERIAPAGDCYCPACLAGYTGDGTSGADRAAPGHRRDTD